MKKGQSSENLFKVIDVLVLNRLVVFVIIMAKENN